MPFKNVQDLVKIIYGPALSLRRLIPTELRRTIHKNLFVASIFLLLFSIFAYAVTKLSVGEIVPFSTIGLLAPRIYGLFLIIFSFTFIFSSLEAMHRSFYFTGLQQKSSQESNSGNVFVSWEVATIVDETEKDVTGAFLNSTFGQEVLYRVGVTEELFAEFSERRTASVFVDTFVVERDNGISLATYVRSLLKQDKEFCEFLAQQNIQEHHVLQSAEWITRIALREKSAKRWWSRDNLGLIPGLGKTWAYGPTYYLERFGHELTHDHVWESARIQRREESDEVEMLERVLSRNRQSNALLLTNDVLSARRRVAQLYHKIRNGNVAPMLESRRVFMLDIELILIAHDEKSDFEAMFLKTMEQAVEAGNVIVYIEHLASAIESAKTMGTDLVERMLPYLETDDIQIVVGELSQRYEKGLSHDTRITQTFDVVEMNDVNESGTLELLEQRALLHERTTGVVFSIPALEKIAESADRYFPSGSMPDKALDLLEELVPLTLRHNKTQVIPRDVEVLVSQVTKVPVGEPTKDERDLLLHLEEILHKRVIAQDMAIDAVAKALRRARSGVGDKDKPLGTFLFLGPTGVGKTETAKALAYVLFGEEDAMIRLDMSEFQGDDALQELIGDPDSEKEGRLETLIRKRQFGVLLLDEFEKSHKSIHDLFLQILDEGSFTSGSGTPIHLKNLIIIATSNAGAELVWQWKREGKDVTKQKDVLIDHIISHAIFRPELLNRFDEVVIFHALDEVHVREITRIHLEEFAKRVLHERNITVIVNDELIDFIAKKGFDPKFGGRPIERAIQDEVEQRIADEILAGELHAGDTYTFSKTA